jgi:integrase/recombinase XerD
MIQAPIQTETDPSNLFQLKISLVDFSPQIWRRVLVPSSISLDQLHSVIEKSMGWEGYHLHQYRQGYVVLEETQALSKVLFRPRMGLEYVYDLGDNWQHWVTLEKIKPISAIQMLPLCVAGANACPPEDCGGPPGYVYVLNVLSKGRGFERDEMREQYGRKIDPRAFDLVAINERLKPEFWND